MRKTIPFMIAAVALGYQFASAQPTGSTVVTSEPGKASAVTTIEATATVVAINAATRTVTVKAVDLQTPSITVVTDDGRTVTRKVENKKNLEGVKVGDKIDITYTQAVVVAVEPAK